MEETILAVGASGKFAGLLIPALAARGAIVRGMAHKAVDAEVVRVAGAREIVVGDLADPASFRRAARRQAGTHSEMRTFHA
jgi:uncharacterized protein YbjT (DUF2867 family)